MVRRLPRLYFMAKISRDVTLFVTGLLGVAHETLVQNGDRPGLLVLFAAMMGLPLYLGGGKGDA